LKPEHFEKIINGIVHLGTLAISAAGFVLSVHTIVKEISVGRAALRKLKEDHEVLKKDFEGLKKEQVELSDEITSLKSDYKRLFETMLTNLPFKQ